jgi:hypothetical protein
MLGGHERDRRRARARSPLVRRQPHDPPWPRPLPCDGWIGLFNPWPLGPPQRNIMLLVTLIIAAVVAVDGAVAVIVIITGGSSPGGYERSATSLASNLSCTAPHPSPSSTDDVNTGLRIHPREVRAPRCRTSESRALAMCFPNTHLNLRARPFYLTLTTTLPFARPFSR